MSEAPKHRPGDIILDHFVPHLGNADRELARARLQEFARWLLHVAMDHTRDEMNIAESRYSDIGGMIEPTSPSHQ